jgi:hypothetical protein
MKMHPSIRRVQEARLNQSTQRQTDQTSYYKFCDSLQLGFFFRGCFGNLELLENLL